MSKNARMRISSQVHVIDFPDFVLSHLWKGGPNKRKNLIHPSYHRPSPLMYNACLSRFKKCFQMVPQPMIPF